MYFDGVEPVWRSKLVDQLLALVAFFLFPCILYVWLKFHSKNEGQINLWYLPAYGFRLVIRNLPRRHALSDIKYRAVMRKVVAASDGSSVATYVDTTLHEKEDFFLFPGTDQVLLCFKIIGERHDNLSLVITDKLGNAQQTLPIADLDLIICDYTATLNNLFNFNVRLAKRAEIKSSTLVNLWQRVRSRNDEDMFEIDRVRNVG